MDNVTRAMGRVEVEEVCPDTDEHGHTIIYPDDIDEYAFEEADRQRRERDELDDDEMEVMQSYYLDDDLPF